MDPFPWITSEMATSAKTSPRTSMADKWLGSREMTITQRRLTEGDKTSVLLAEQRSVNVHFLSTANSEISSNSTLLVSLFVSLLLHSAVAMETHISRSFPPNTKAFPWSSSNFALASSVLAPSFLLFCHSATVREMWEMCLFCCLSIVLPQSFFFFISFIFHFVIALLPLYEFRMWIRFITFSE